MASSHSSPTRPSTPTQELQSVRKRRKSSPASPPVETGRNDGNRERTSSPTRLSLRRLKQGESHQRIRHGASELLRLSEGFAGYDGDAPGFGFRNAHNQPLPSGTDLRAMARLSHSIANDLTEIFALRNDHPDGPKPDDADDRHRVQSLATGHASVVRKARHKAEFYCHKCHRVDTPQWRLGPDGPMTLCNVCGLIYAKRTQN